MSDVTSSSSTVTVTSTNSGVTVSTGVAALVGAVANDDSRLSDRRVPLDGSVTDSTIVSGGLSAASISGTAVLNGDSRLSDKRVPLDGSVTPSKRSHAQAYDTFAGTGPAPVTASTGQTYVHTGAPLPTVLNGLLTATKPSTGSAAGYSNLHPATPDAQITRIGADFIFDPETVAGNNAVGLIMWSRDMGGAIPAAPCHLAIRTNGWTYSNWVENVGIHQLATGTFATPLTADGATVYTCEVLRNGNTSTILLPDGTYAKVTDPAIGNTSGVVACWEEYYLDASKCGQIYFKRTWAETDSAPDSSLAVPTKADVMAVASRVANTITSQTPKNYFIRDSTTSSIATPNTTYTAIDSTNLVLPVVFPASGKMLVTLSADLSIITACGVVWSVYGPGQLGAGELSALYTVGRSRQTLSIPVSATPGSAVNLIWYHFANIANAAYFVRSSAPQDFATMLAQPL